MLDNFVVMEPEMKYYVELYDIVLNVKNHPIPKVFNIPESLKYC